MFDTPPFPADAPRFGDGRFVIVSRIGQGRTGAVYRGYDLAQGEWRAFKVLSVERASEWEAWDRFVRDGLLLARTAHPNLVRVYEVIGGRSPFLVMDLVTGGTLQRWIDRHGPMPARMACSAVLEVARAVAAIHASGGVHGAIGPANVLVTLHGTRQLSDLSANHDPHERSVDVAALGDLLRRLCGSDLPPKLAQIASGCGVGPLQIAADVAEAMERVCASLPDDPDGAPDPVLNTTGGERAVRTAALPPELARLVGDAGVVPFLSDAVTQPNYRRDHDWVDTTTGDTVRFGATTLIEVEPSPEPTDSGALTAGSTSWFRASPSPDAEATEPDSETLRFGLGDPPSASEDGADPDSVTVPRLGGAGPRPGKVARLPVGGRPRTVGRPAATTEVPRLGAGGFTGSPPPSGRFDEEPWQGLTAVGSGVRSSSGEGSDPDEETTDRADRPGASPWDLGHPGADRRFPTPSTLGEVRIGRPSGGADPRRRGGRQPTSEPPPLPPHLRGGAVEPRTIAPAGAEGVAPEGVLASPAPALPSGTGCLSMVMVPASATFGLALAAMALAALLIGTAARDLAGKAAAAEGARAELHQVLQQHAVLIDRLAARSGERAPLEAAFRTYMDARTEPERTDAAMALIETVDRVGTLQEDGAEVSYRLKQLRSARVAYERSLVAWQASTGSARGRLVVSVGLAPAAPEVGGP